MAAVVNFSWQYLDNSFVDRFVQTDQNELFEVVLALDRLPTPSALLSQAPIHREGVSFINNWKSIGTLAFAEQNWADQWIM